MSDIEREFKEAIVESYRVNGRASTVSQGADLAWEATRHLFAELDDAVDELVTETERLATLAWSPVLHDNTVDTLAVEAAADHLKEQLGE